MEFPTDGPVVLRDGMDVALLVSYLRSVARTKPVVVLTVARGETAPYVRSQEIVAEFGRDIDVVTLPTDQLTYKLRDAVGQYASVYDGACRVYAVGEDWEQRPNESPLRLARDSAERKDLKRKIFTDVRVALRSGQRAATPSPPAPPRGRLVGVPSPSSMPGSGRPAAPATQLLEIASQADAVGLANHLRNPQRRRPVAVITRASGAATAYADVDEIRGDLAGLADVVEITTPEASWAFSREVPDMCQVYGGASRVYPVGDGWLTDPYLSPLRFAYGLADRLTVTRLIISDAMAMAPRAEFRLDAGVEAPAEVTGTVDGVVGDRGLVTLTDGRRGTLWPELVEPGLPAERLFCKGMAVHGTYDPESRRIDVRAMRLPAVDALASYSDGDTVLARVTAVDDAGCDVELFPGETRRMPADVLVSGGALVTELVEVGDVVPLWLGEMDDGEWLLSLLDAADPADAVPAPSILHGGPPWLVEQQSVAAAPAPPEPEVEEDDGDLPEDQQRERAQLVKQMRGLKRENDELRTQLKTSRTKLRDAEKRLKRRQTQVDESDRYFLDDADQLDFEIRVAWARMTEPSEKKDRPLKKWTYSRHFFATMNAVEGISRDKIVEVIVHVLTGRDAELTSRERHQLREGWGGDEPPRVRNNGSETAWRVSLQVKTPSARRLHYWMCKDGSIELSSIRLHDDMRT